MMRVADDGPISIIASPAQGWTLHNVNGTCSASLCEIPMNVARREGVRVAFSRKVLPIAWAREWRDRSLFVPRSALVAGGVTYLAGELPQRAAIQQLGEGWHENWMKEIARGDSDKIVGLDSISESVVVLNNYNPPKTSRSFASVHLLTSAGQEQWAVEVPHTRDLVGRGIAFNRAGDILVVCNDAHEIAGIVAVTGRDGRFRRIRRLPGFNVRQMGFHRPSNTVFLVGVEVTNTMTPPQTAYRSFSLVVTALDGATGEKRWTRKWRASQWANPTAVAVTNSGVLLVAGTMMGELKIPGAQAQAIGRKRPGLFALAVSRSGTLLGSSIRQLSRSPVNVVAAARTDGFLIATVTAGREFPPRLPLRDLETEIEICTVAMRCATLSSMRGHVWTAAVTGERTVAVFGDFMRGGRRFVGAQLELSAR
jgi:hypothetical protein